MNKNPSPPKLPLRFFRWYCHPDYREDIEGDLLERFERRVQEKGANAAKWLFFTDVIRLFRPGIIRSWEPGQSFNNYSMFKNYFKITWRSLLKQKLYTFINIGGLAVGLTCFILIFLYVQHELSYDRFYENADRIYRIYQKQEGNFHLGSDYFTLSPAPLATTLTKEFPEVTHATSIAEETALLGHEENHYWEKGLWADASFFEVFTYPFVYGNPKTALVKPESIVLTASLSQKIFGARNPVGQSLIFQNGDPYTVTGVIKDPPVNTSFKFSFISCLLSHKRYMWAFKNARWGSNSFHAFFTMAEHADPLQLQNKLPAMYEKYKGNNKNYPFRDTYFVQPLSEIHLETKANFDIGLKGNAKYLSLLSLIAVVVLLLACVNYMNLAVACSIKRAREIGLRKVIGAVRWQLIGQFIGESVLIACLGLLLAIGLTYFLTPVFGHLLERPIELNLIENTLLIPGLVVLVVVVGILSGSYPAFFMSSLRPVQVLKGKINGRFSGMKIQSWLIVGQYAMAIVLVISSLVIYQQFRFIQQKELGYNKEHIVTIPIRGNRLRENLEVIKNEWLSNTQILGVATSTQLPTNIRSSTIINDHDDRKENDLSIYETGVDYDYLEVFNMELIAGRNFSSDSKTDPTYRHIINETAAKALGWTPEEAIGNQFVEASNKGAKTVIGVVKDFHMHSMHMAIAPLMIRLNTSHSGFLSVKIQPDNLSETLAILETSFKKYSPYPFEYKFLDEQFDQLYKAELRLGEMFVFFTVISILIASMGLFGLAAFTAGQRTKEIGIRKVLGASVQGIVGILAKDFLKMVLAGFLLAIPVAWYFMHQWLADFAYRIEMEWWMFAMAGFAAMVIALFTISSQSIKAALTNPVDSLKNE
ncbi:ABC transporter permease [Fulvivirgaceae bacterium BMA12]|uniref:ABC transporter permease n=1 Tax=Agaribacillus aureus TaxID=3051825 RepID=A0ABT8L4M5_9BACT|nr:ABC transporter permease [Fulvivirgaceae bacterium BMA12]